ncbi:sugar phosphate isomerase/epimerase family protein [Priestia megaterium]|jgi:D-psicose/D-tagatose/L-ribulose 3-epimerase|uniref:sugar phosphate isomerase/epimerase family protein n=1 Tax=Priestia megaterium TaxID=1404 RepID=UPI003F8022FD
MKFSICSWTFGDIPLEKTMEFVANTGYDGIEIRAAVDNYNWNDIRKHAENLNLEISGLTGATGWPNEEQDLANASADNRKKAVAYFERQIEAVKEVGGEYLVVCPSAVGKTAPMGTPGEDWKWAIDSVQKLTRKAEEMDITLVIEPLNRYESCIVNTGAQGVDFVDEINHPKVKMLLDSYHMNIEDPDFESPFSNAGNKLHILHVADSNRRAIGRGHIDFTPFISGIKKVDFDGYVVVEATAPGPNPFQPNKGANMDMIYTFTKENLTFLQNNFRFTKQL